MLSPFDLTAGQRLATQTFTISAADAQAYVQAVADPAPLYQGAAAPLPPLLLAARALQLLMAQVEIPGGTIHTGQECEFLAAVPAERELLLSAVVARAATRQGQRFLTLEMLVTDGDRQVCRGRASLVIPESGTSRQP